MYEDDDVFNATALAREVMTEYLISCFQDADILDIMNNDPDCVLLTDDDWEAVREAFAVQRQVFVKVD